MIVINWSFAWFRIQCASLLLWDVFVSLYLRLVSIFRRSGKANTDIPLPATSSSSRSFSIQLSFPLPAFTRDNRHRSEFEASQRRLRHSIRLHRAAPLPPKRCTTPLLPFHTIPNYASDEDQDLCFEPPPQLWDENCDLSTSSSPTLTLHTPLSTSTVIQAVDPFVVHGDSFYTPPDHIGILSLADQDSGDVLLVDQFKAKRNPTIHPTESCNNFSSVDVDLYHPRRRFCACKNTCSDFVSISPTLRHSSQAGTNSMRIHQPMKQSSAYIHRRHSFDNGTPSNSGPQSQRSLVEPLIDRLDLVLPCPSENPGPERQGELTPWVPFPRLKSETIVQPPPALRRSEAYEAWMSSWCFRPTVPRSPKVLPPEILDSPTLQPSYLRSPCTSSPKVSVSRVDPPNSRMCATSGATSLTRLSPHGRNFSKNSRVLSGMTKLQNLRELLAALDQSMANSALPQVSPSPETKFNWPDLDCDDVDSKRRLGPEVKAGRAF